MTQAPTPGPLSGDDVKLLVKLLDTLKPFAEVAEKLKHCHVVEICEPSPDNPSRNIIPMPREWFERAGDDLEAIVIQLHATGVLSEGQASKITGLDRGAVRRLVDCLAPTAPVEASGSEREFETAEAMAEAWSDRVEVQHMVDVTSAVFAKWASPELLSRFRQQMMAVIQQAYIEGVGARVEAIRPQPSGETREGYVNAFYEIAEMLGMGAQAASPSEVWAREMRPRLEALIRPAPVAETAGEAVAWLYTENRWKDGPRHRLSMQRQAISDDDKNEFEITEQPLYAAPVPAQDDDRLRIAVEALKDIQDTTAELGTNQKATEALAALQSTAAQEGGE